MSSAYTVRLHPYVLFQIVDAHERRPKPTTAKDGKSIKSAAGERDYVVGCILGSYDRDSVVVSNSFVFKVGIQVNEQTGEVSRMMDTKLISDLRDHYRLVSPSEQIVGWYSTAGQLQEVDLDITHVIEKVVNSGRPADRPKLETFILLVDCPSKESDPFSKLNPRAYVRTMNGIPMAPGVKNAKSVCHVAMFNRLPLKLEQYRPERVLTELLTTEFTEHVGDKQRGARREIQLSDGVSKLHVSLKEMSKWIENIRDYVDKVISGEIKADPKLGRKLLDIVNNPTARMGHEQLEKVISGSIRDHLMISYLAQVAEAQMAIYEKMVESVL